MVMSIAIVTDSTSDIPPDLVEKYSISVVPNILVLNGQSFEDGTGLSREEFYNLIPEMKSLPTTSTASPGVYMRLYERLFKDGATDILSVHAAGTLSGIINAASSAAESFEGKVRVVDSASVTLGLGFQVLMAAEAAVRGATIEVLLTLLNDLRKRARVFAMLDTLEYVRRSGRVSWARARLGNLLHLKPFVELREGIVYSLGETRTRHKGIEQLKKFLFDQGPIERLAILHTNAEADARQFLEDVNIHLQAPPLIVNVTTIIGTHVGPNGLGFAAVVK
jgi:fatty acid kinase fatty acid binding subunit